MIATYTQADNKFYKNIRTDSSYLKDKKPNIWDENSPETKNMKNFISIYYGRDQLLKGTHKLQVSLYLFRI